MLYKTSAVCFIGATGIILSHIGIRLPLYLDSAFTAMPFFYFGQLLRNTRLLYGHITKKEIIIGLACLLLTILIPIFFFAFIDFRSNVIIGNSIIALSLPYFGVTGVLLLCKLINYLPYFSYIGRYSIVILGFHYPLLTGLKSVHHDFGDLTNYLIFLELMLSMPLLIYVCVKFIPYLTAQKDILPIKRTKVSIQTDLE